MVRLWPFLGGSNHTVEVGDGDGYFDLDDLEYSFDFGEYEGATPFVLSVVTISY